MAALALASLVVLDNVKLAATNFVFREINNFKHVPFFGVLSLFLLGLITLIFGKSIKNRIMHYFIAFTLAAITGGISEYLQIAGPRDADVMDFLRDIAGAFSFLGFYMFIDRRLEEYRQVWSRRTKAAIFYAAIFSIILTLIPIALKTAACIRRYEISPSISTFDSFLENYYIKATDAKLEKALMPAGSGISNMEHVARVTFYAAPYPGLTIEGPYPDWTDYKYLCFMVYSELKNPVALNIRIDDTYRNPSYQDRFNSELIILPGLNNIQIPLEDIKSGPARREMDIGAISTIYIFGSAPDKPFSLYLGEIKLK